MLIYGLWEMNTPFFYDLAKYALTNLVIPNKEGEHPLGSWKDIKYFCEYCTTEQLLLPTHPLIRYAISLYNTQINKDLANLDVKYSLCAKWIPREKSKQFGWIFEEISKQYFGHYFKTSLTEEQKKKAILKCKTNFRKIISNMNKHLDTVQIKQCNKTWADIDHSKNTSITTMKQTKAFLNVTKKGDIRSYDEDRIKCSEHFKDFITNKSSSIKGKRVGLNDFTKKAIELIMQKRYEPYTTEIEIKLLNAQWTDNGTQTKNLDKIIAMVDVSGSMDGDPLHSAIALGIRVAEKSMLGKRVMTFSEKPTWHNLDTCNTFVEMVDSLKKAEWGMTTDFYSAFDKILAGILESNLSPEEVEGFILAIFSDMQINEASASTEPNMNTMMDVMTRKYADAGMGKFGKPYPLPHILFWNLRSTSGFPASAFHKNVTMFSGFSPSLLNQFCENGMEGLKETDPWTKLVESVQIPRYDFLDQQVDSIPQ